MGCFHLLAAVTSAAVNAGPRIYLYQIPICTSNYFKSDFHSFRYTPRSGLVGSDGNSMFSYLRNHQTVSYGSYTILRSHQQRASIRIPVSPHSHQLLLFFSFLITAILMGTKRSLIMVVT